MPVVGELIPAPAERGSSEDRSALLRHLMTAPAVTVHVETPIRRAADLMVDRHIHRLVVVDDQDRPVGILSSLDLLKTLATPGS